MDRHNIHVTASDQTVTYMLYIYTLPCSHLSHDQPQCYCITVEPQNADTFGNKEKCPDYRGVPISGSPHFEVPLYKASMKPNPTPNLSLLLYS